MNRKRAARFMTHELALAQGYVRTPGGFRHRSYVHRLDAGQAVAKRPGVSSIVDLATRNTVAVAQPSMPPQDLAGSGGGWVTWASWANATGSPISSFATTWVVPAAPVTQSNQLIYLFNALEDQAGDDIVQPVLQWGESGAGGGNYWGVSNWYVDSNHHAFCTPVVPVNEGDELTGLLTLSSQAGGLFNYVSAFENIPGATLIAQGLSELVVATETLEVYGLTKSSDYPNGGIVRMTKIDLSVTAGAAALNWTAEVMSNPTFGEHTTIVSNAAPNGEVDLYF
jgi:hypothetical protein